MTGGRDIGHDERLSVVLDATVDTSVFCTKFTTGTVLFLEHSN